MTVQILSCTSGFLVSVGWIYAASTEVIDVVQMLGVISHLSPEVGNVLH